MTEQQAPVGLMAGRRRSLKPGNVLVTLEDLLIVTWELPEATLRQALPTALTPVSRAGRALASAVFFRNRALRPAILGAPRFSGFQVNLRSYILDPETRRPGCVFFHGLFVNSLLLRGPFARLSAWLFGVPFLPLPLRIEVERRGGRVTRWLATSGRDLRVLAREELAPVEGPPSPETLDLLTNPHTGYVEDTAGKGLRVWSLWHPSQRVRTLEIEEVSVGIWSEAGLDLDRPISALYVPSVDYEVYLPARLVSLRRDPGGHPNA